MDDAGDHEENYTGSGLKIVSEFKYLRINISLALNMATLLGFTLLSFTTYWMSGLSYQYR